MANLIEFETKRLLLRQWLPADCEPFVVLNTDPKVMKYFPSLLPRTEIDAMADPLSVTHRRAWVGLLGCRMEGHASVHWFCRLAHTIGGTPFLPLY